MKSLKRYLLLPLLLFAFASSLTAATGYNQNIVAIFGSGNPDTGWTTGSNGDLVLGLRAKDRVTGLTTNITGAYTVSVGVVAPANNRAKWNWEFSINSGSVKLNMYDFYLEIDIDPSWETNNVVVNALTNFADNSYGNSLTLNGQGVEGLASVYAPILSVAQQSQNIAFYGLLADAFLDSTYTYTLYAVASGAGQNGVRIASTSIAVIVGYGGTRPPDDDRDGVPDSIDVCPDTAWGQSVNTQGCSIWQELKLCAVGAKNHGELMACVTAKLNALMQAGTITAHQRSEYLKAIVKWFGVK